MFFRLNCIFTLIVIILLAGCPTSPHIVVEESIEDLQKVAEEDPNDFIAYHNLGLAYTAQKQYDQALDAFHKVLELEPHFSDACFSIYCVEYAKDDKLFDESLEEEPTPAMKDKIDEVDSYLKSAVMYDPFFDWKISTILMDNKPSAHGNTYLREFIDAVYDRFLAGFIQFRLGNYDRAVKKLDFLIEMNPDFTQAYLIRGFAQLHLGKYNEAIKDFQSVIDEIEEYNKKKILPVYLNPAELYYLIGHAYFKQGNLDKAEETFKKVIMENMGFYMAHFQLSNIYDQRKSFIGALQEMNAAIIAKPDDPVFRFNKGYYMSRFGQATDAIKEYNEAISINPNYSKSYFNLAIVYEAIGNKEEAVKNYQIFIDKAPKRLNTYIEEAKKRIKALEEK